jgi:hypothetical protein
VIALIDCVLALMCVAGVVVVCIGGGMVMCRLSGGKYFNKVDKK